MHYTAIFDLNSAKINPNVFEKQKFKKWRSIAIFGHFAKAIVGQNGYKMVDYNDQPTR